MASQMRSGRIFSPVEKVIRCSNGFDFEKLLQRSVASEDAHLSDDIDVVHANSSLDFIPATANVDPAHVPPSASSSSASALHASQGSAAEHAKKRASATKLGNDRRKRRREEGRAQEDEHPVSPAALAYIQSAAVISTETDASDLSALNGAYGAKPKRESNADAMYSKDDLVKLHGFTPIEWDGVTPMVVADSKNRAFIAFLGRPDDPQYLKACESLHDAMEDMGSAAGLSGNVKPHTRGHFPAVNVGVLHGKGTTKPVNLNNKQYVPLVTALLARSDLQRLARFASTSFAGLSPKLYGYYKAHLDTLFEKMPELRRIFPAHTSVFPTAAFNFGPNVWTYKHRDVTNCPFGWCAIQALGRFDPKKGGHLVLWEPKLVVEFPPGALVFIPSATITHSNIPVAPGDKRMSFTQYAPGGLFRYVDYGLRLEKELKKQDPQLYADILRLRPTRWEMGLGLLPTVEELQK